jgi:hypothetical protein
MSLGACLPGLEADGKLSAEQAAEARALYDELVAEHVRTGSAEAAEALASASVLEALERQVTRKAFLAGRTIKARTRIAADLGGYGGGSGGGGKGGGGGGPIDPRAGPALLDHDPRARYSNVEGRRKAVLGQAHRHIDGILAEHSAGMLGKVRNKAQLDEIVRELFDRDSGNPAARELAQAWRETAEMLRRRFNRAGGEIGYRADWGLPQSHDWQAVRKAGYEAWRDFILPRLAPERMIDRRTGQPFTAGALEPALRDVWESIRTNGWADRKPGAAGGKALANRRADPRFLVFRDAQGWSEYAETFGAGNAYDAMMGHIEGMARDIAAMEVLGPNPDATLRWVKDSIEQSAARDTSPDSKAVSAARSKNKRLDDLWDEYTGSSLEPRNETWAKVGSAYRALWTARRLGSAFLSATSDMAFQASRRRFNGLAQASVIPQYLKLFTPGSIEHQKMAVRRGLIAEEWAHRTAGQSRYLMEELNGELARRTANWVLRASLLVRHTQSARWAYGMETLATYTEHAGTAFDQLHPKLRNALQRYGIDAAGWDRLRAAPMDVDGGVEWLNPHNLGDDEASVDLASKFMEMIHEETDIAVPVADLGTRAFYNNKFERGTFIGEVMRSGPLMARSFGIAVLLRQIGEIMAMTPARAARYAGGLIIGTTLMGALSLQLRELAAGRDPRPMEDGGFWGSAMAQGGGWGIFGDFINSAESRAQHGVAITLAGALPQDVQDLVDVGKSAHPADKALRTAKGWLPGNNLWYARTAFDRMLADQLQEAVDPDYRKSWKRIEHYAHENGTEYWWSPGDDAPERAPAMGNALEEGPGE